MKGDDIVKQKNNREKKINEMKSWIFEINKIDTPVIKLTKNKGKKTNDQNQEQKHIILIIRNLRTGMTEVEKGHSEQPCNNILYSLDKMDKFRKRCKIPKLIQEETI